MSKPRIALLHYAAPPTIGGVESTIAAHARLFAAHRYPVKIIAGRGEPFDANIPVEIIRDLDSQSDRVLTVHAELTRGIVSERFHVLVRDLNEALANSLADYDVLIAHNTLSLHKNLALTAALQQLHRIQVIAWCHDFAWTDPQYADDIHPGFPWNLLKQPWTGIPYVVVSEARKKELEDLWTTTGNISVIPPGIDLCEFLGVTATTRNLVSALGLADAEPLLLLPARLTRRKKIERAIEIIAAMRRQATNAKLVVTGPPGPHNPANLEYLTQLRMLRNQLGTNNAVLFLYEHVVVDDLTRRDLFLLADALLFPSEREGFGIPLLEAGLARLPIFCSDLTPFHESASKYAHYFSDSASAEAIATLIHDVLKRDRAYQLKRHILHQYAWQRIFSEQIEPLVQGD
jgi:glycosyltransferase involved in cell wall biosynthesis